MFNKSNKGFTLMELLIAMFITTIVAAATFSAYLNQQEAQQAQQQVAEMQQNLRMALYTMTSEIRMAGYDPYGTRTAGITNAGDGSNGNHLTFTFVADDDDLDNNDVDGTDELGELKTISYDLYTGLGDGDTDIARTLTVGANPPQRVPLAENIQSLNFAYLDVNGNVTAVITEIRSVQITIVATKDITSRADINNRTLTTTIKCRNLGL